MSKFLFLRKQWYDIRDGVRSLLIHDVSLRKPQPSKPYHGEENNEHLVRSNKVNPWMDRLLATFPPPDQCCELQVVTII